MAEVKTVERAMEAADPRFMASLARGLEVLQAFEGNSGLTVTDAARLTGLSRSSAARCLFTLERLGYVRAIGPQYRLMPGLLPLARAYIHSDPLAVAGQSAIDSVRDQLQESSSMAVFACQKRYETIVYICRSEAARIMAVPLLVGSTLPSFCTSMGRALLAGLDEDELAAWLSTATFPKRTPKTLTSPNAIAQDIARTKKRGWALSDEELELGLRSISVPIRGKGGHVVAALNAGANANRRSVRWLVETALPKLQAAAAHLSRVQ